MLCFYDIDELFLVVETRMGFKVASIIGRNHWLFQDFHSMIFKKKPTCNIFHFISPSQVKNVDGLLFHGTWSCNFVHKYLLCEFSPLMQQIYIYSFTKTKSRNLEEINWL
jgi:hypothetical protein